MGRRKRRLERKRRRRLILFSLALVVIALVGATVLLTLQRERVEPVEEHIRGDANAEVAIIEYSDFECPFCAKIQSTLEQLLKDYEGRVKLVFRHFPQPSLHPNAWKAAEASECAAEEGRFWEYHDKLFSNQKALTIANLKRYAEELGLNRTRFESCLDSGLMSKRVQEDVDKAKSLKLPGTPAFLIDGKLILGAEPYDTFKKIIDGILKG